MQQVHIWYCNNYPMQLAPTYAIKGNVQLRNLRTQSTWREHLHCGKLPGQWSAATRGCPMSTSSWLPSMGCQSRSMVQ